MSAIILFVIAYAAIGLFQYVLAPFNFFATNMSMSGKRYYGTDAPRSTGPHPDPLDDTIDCPGCNGTGKPADNTECEECNGHGKVTL